MHKRLLPVQMSMNVFPDFPYNYLQSRWLRTFLQFMLKECKHYMTLNVFSLINAQSIAILKDAAGSLFLSTPLTRRLKS